MANWNQHDLRPRMKVHASTGEQIGHVAEIYPDSFLVHKGYFLPANRYFPYSAISSVREDSLQLTLSPTEAQDRLWSKRPDYEHHLGDPLQLFYDRAHGLHDPYDDTGFDQPTP